MTCVRRLGAPALLVILGLLVLPACASSHVDRFGSFFDGFKGNPFTLTTPAAVEGLENVTAISASNGSAYALESDGSVWAWGDGSKGELGNGGEADSATPVQVQFPQGTHIVAIGEAKDEGFAIDSTGQGWGWGLNGYGSLCEKGGGKHVLPTKVPGVTTATAVAGGENHTLWLLANGTVESCGTNAQGQLGVGSAISSSNVAIPVPGLSGIVEISAGERTSAVRDSEGRVFMWGSNTTGAVGDGTGVNKYEAVFVIGDASQVASGGDLSENAHSFALVAGELWGWGCDTNRQIGDGSPSNKLSPVATGLHFTKVVASGKYSLGLDGESNVWAWGSGEGYGTGVGTTKVTQPVVVDTRATMISGTARDSLDAG